MQKIKNMLCINISRLYSNNSWSSCPNGRWKKKILWIKQSFCCVLLCSLPNKASLCLTDILVKEEKEAEKMKFQIKAKTKQLRRICSSFCSAHSSIFSFVLWAATSSVYACNTSLDHTGCLSDAYHLWYIT